MFHKYAAVLSAVIVMFPAVLFAAGGQTGQKTPAPPVPPSQQIRPKVPPAPQKSGLQIAFFQLEAQGVEAKVASNGDGTWNVAGSAYGCDRSGGNCGYKVGLPFAAVRGGYWYYSYRAGVFTLHLSLGPSYSGDGLGARCCMHR